ncbi:hypothetical protein [Catenuloplanes japonicus]|uniref:hypothetical protein n=1 Tax=Catenuloplanes japonicus TaxID=33876 RepID=UPI000AA1C8B2|nr:hypothetical protein [Catenuloplanes japonicus]
MTEPETAVRHAERPAGGSNPPAAYPGNPQVALDALSGPNGDAPLTEERIRAAIGAVIVQSGCYDADDNDPNAPDYLQWHHCHDEPACPGATRPCACSGVPYVSDALWAHLQPIVDRLRHAERDRDRLHQAIDDWLNRRTSVDDLYAARDQQTPGEETRHG